MKNRELALATERRWRLANREHVIQLRRNQNWKGILNDQGNQFTTIDFDRAYQFQLGGCKICKRHSSEFKKHLAVDHDHQTMKFRGLLCAGCNLEVGRYENDRKQDIIKRYLNGGI